MDLQHDFEDYLRWELPYILNLSPSKQVATAQVFYHFSDLAMPLAKKAPKEFADFFRNLKAHFHRISKWRCPSSHKIAPMLTKCGAGFTVARRAGRTMYTMCQKKGRGHSNEEDT